MPELYKNEAKLWNFHSQKLSLGSEGEEVSLLHKERKVLIFEILDPNVSSTSFGLNARDAVVSFQSSHGLSPYDSMIKKYARQQHCIHSMLKPGTYRVPGRG